MGARLYIVRHGQTLWNVERRMQGHTDIPLSGVGLREAEAVAGRLARLPITSVVASDLARARSTAEVIADRHSLPVTVTPLLREVGLGDWEGMTADEIALRDGIGRLQAYRRDPDRVRPPNGESLDSMWQRMSGSLDLISRTALGACVVVGHGGSLRALVCLAAGLGRDHMRDFSLSNASITTLEDGVIVNANDTRHLVDVR